MERKNDKKDFGNLSFKDPMPMPKKKNTFAKVLFIGLLLFLAGAYLYENYIKNADFSKMIQIKKKAKEIVIDVDLDDALDSSSPSTELSDDEEFVEEVIADEDEFEFIDEDDIISEYEVTLPSTSTSSTTSKATAEPNKEKEDYSNLSTLEILERKNHESAVEQARRAGVSTEGSTIDILERINHKRVVEQGKQAGVSTEGSTIDILERINHKRVVEQARRAGVSTEGSTTEILERITRKSLEKYGY